MSELAVELRGIRKAYPSFTLRDVDLDVPFGTVLGLVGPNGAGKSILLRILVGLVRADADRVTVLGRLMPDEDAWVKGLVGFVSGDMAFYGDATFARHMRLVCDLAGGWDERRAAELLDTSTALPESSFSMERRTRLRQTHTLTVARDPGGESS